MKMKSFIFSVILFFLTFVPVASLYATATSIPYIGASWNHNPTVYITLQKGVDSSYEALAFAALDDWINELDTSFSYVPLSSAPGMKTPADISIQIKKNTGAVLGSTKISASSGTLIKTSITIASQNAMGNALDPADFSNILRHELGHALGLGHADDNGSGDKDLMYPYYDYIEIGSDVLPSAFDISALIYLYTSDGFGGSNFSPVPQTYP